MAELVREGPSEDQTMTLNMGPQHPCTHGVLRFVVARRRESCARRSRRRLPAHRSIEKIAEKVGYHGFMPYTDRDRLRRGDALQPGLGDGLAEKLAGIEVPRRGEYCRVIRVLAAVNRIASHLLSVGTMAMDIGAVSTTITARRPQAGVATPREITGRA